MSKSHLERIELDLLRVLLRHANVPLARDRIEELAHGLRGGSGGRGVDAHVHRLRAKIEDDPARPGVLRTLRGDGYVLVPGPAPGPA